tara:strand:- start:2868 stop:3065 length:198 start_codon:yes stop_codon:yes gene_type:complete
MFKVGDRVVPYHQMSNSGIIVEIKREKSNTWMVGGASDARTIITVQHDNKEVKKWLSSDLLRDDQ